MSSSIPPFGDDAHPLAYHYYAGVEEAVEAVQAADMLELPFVLYSAERDEELDGDSETMVTTKEYVLVLLPPGTDFEPYKDDDGESVPPR